MMKKSFKYMAVAAITCLAGHVSAQDLRTGFLSDQFYYRHNINPAIENDSNYMSFPFLGNINVDMMGNFGYEELVRDNPLYPDRSNKKKTSFLNPYLTNPLNGFSSGDNKINGQLKLTLFSWGFKKWGGYNTLEVSERTSVNFSAPYKLFQFAADLANTTYDIGDVHVNAQSFAEIALGHSRQYDDRLRVGVKAKVLLGVANADLDMKDVNANLTDEKRWTITANNMAHVSMAGFKYRSKTKEYNNKPGTYDYVNDADLGLGISGFGLAVDAGAVYVVNEELKVSAALQDLGAIIWTNDHQAANDAEAFVFDGFHDVSIDSSSPDVLDNKADNYGDQFLDFANLRDKGDKGARLTGIGATVNAGAEYIVPTYRALKLGLLGTFRINGPYSWAEGRFIGNIKPVDWFDGSLSFAVNSYTASFGFLANFHFKKYNLFLGADRLVGKMSKEFIPLSSNGGISLGFNFIL